MTGPNSVANSITINGFAVMTQPRNKNNAARRQSPFLELFL